MTDLLCPIFEQTGCGFPKLELLTSQPTHKLKYQSVRRQPRLTHFNSLSPQHTITMASGSSSSILFSDTFTLDTVDRDGKKFDRGKLN